MKVEEPRSYTERAELGRQRKDEEYDEQHNTKNTSNSSICNPLGDPEDTSILRGKTGTDGRHHNTTVDTKRRSDDEDNAEELEAERQCSSSLLSLSSTSSAGNTTSSRKSIADQKQRGEVVDSCHTTTTVDTLSRGSEGGEDNDAAGEVLEEAGRRQRTSCFSSLKGNSMKRKAIDNHKLQEGATPIDRHSTSDDTSQRSDDEEKDGRELPEAEERQRTSLHLLASRSTTEITPRTSRRKLII
ncbi:predicted protein [Chaetoceros tenuissimus]|uniref:Uncharacterized protein n=1 Tax=Chaetoceros tenuissimus TaxID=426638 RepID=A0AAD3DAY2_9STRA|nr:predicted protein [Chaetoceros tenuissimus]